MHERQTTAKPDAMARPGRLPKRHEAPANGWAGVSITYSDFPYIVEREFQTRQIADYSKNLAAAVGAIESLLKRGLSEDSEDAAAALGTWADSVAADRHPLP